MNKLLSARFLLAVMFGFTSCLGFILGKISGELFIGIVMVIITAYFAKERKLANDKS